MQNRFKIALTILIVILVSGVIAVYYAFNKPHRNIENEIPVYSIEATTLFDEFNHDKTLASQMYVDEVIEVTGFIAELFIDSEQVSIFLNTGVSCELDSLTIKRNAVFLNSMEVGDQITLKGKCDGFDMILGVVITRCFIVD
jgi:hypothetical protein